MMPRRQGLIEHAADLLRGWQFDAAYALLHVVVTDPMALDAIPPVRRATLLRLYNDVLRERGDLALALCRGVRLLADCRRQFGDNHPATLRAMLSVAATRFLAGDDTAAKSAFSVVAAHPLTTIVSGLAKEGIIARAYLTLFTANTVGKADALAIVLCDCRIVLGPIDPCTVRITIELAHLYATAGDRDAATQLLKAARNGVVTCHGGSHPLAGQLELALDALNRGVAESAATVASSINGSPRAATTRQGPGGRWLVTRVASRITVAAACLATIGMLAAATPPSRPVPVTWIAGTVDLRPHDLRVHVANDAVTVTWADPTDTATPTVVITIGGVIRSTVTLSPGTTRHTVRGIGSGVVCATVILSTGIGQSGSAAACASEPR